MNQTAGTPTRSEQPSNPVLTHERQTELAVIALVLDDATSYPWSIEELTRTIGSRPDVLDAVSNLVGAGLLHRTDQFVWPTLAARRAVALEETS